MLREMKCEYRFCGNTFVIDGRRSGTPKRYCSKMCAKKEGRAARSIDGKTYKVCGASSQLFKDMMPCKCDLHSGSPMVAKAEFYTWKSDSGTDRRSTWCKTCLQRWILMNEMSDEHGQHFEADDQARLDIYSGSYDTYKIDGFRGELDAVDMAMRLVTGRVV